MPTPKPESAADSSRPRTELTPAAEAPAMPMPVVAIGASAGGLEACTTLLRHTPADTGLAFVVVQHLDPHHPSALPELLAKATAMPVVAITDGMPLAADRVHVLPPDAGLTIEGNQLRLLPRGTARPTLPIDSFLRSLAEARGSEAMAVILSGSGSDGSLGVLAIREHGGVNLAQSPADAGFDGMPSSAIATGCVDGVLPADQLGSEIVRLHREMVASRDGGAANEPAGDPTARRDVIALLRTVTGVDFTHYRLTTFQRRLARRRALVGMPDLTAYLEHLRANPGEVQELAQDLLISVTHFFRDPEVFAYLAQTAFPDLIRRAGPEGVVRLWVPGCSSGEEAYSLAITFVETAQRMHSQVTCQVFATDVNETVLTKARRATFLENIAADVSPERLTQFFQRDIGGYRLQRSIRNLCVFSRHDLLVDPPMSRMAMVSCRNLLIYLEAAQRQALQALHFALEPHGYLLLGRSESTSACPDLFEPVSKDFHLFRALESVTGRTFPRPIGQRDARRRLPAAYTSETANDAAAYEELVAANEELQSLNEELESSKEEIESVNEELLTLNQELRDRNRDLHVAHDFSAATLDTVHSGLLVLDDDYKVVHANRSFFRIFHLLPTEVERHRITAVLPDYFASPKVLHLLEQARTQNAGADDVEVEVEQPGSGRRMLSMNVRRFAAGDLFLLSVDDVTLLRQLEADRRQSQKMEAIGHLAAGVAHDFNNLLTVVLSGAQLIGESMPADAELRPVAENISAAALRAADLTRQLLAFAGKSRFYLERVQLADIVVQTANLLHASTPPHVQLRLDLDRSLPPLLTDPSQMHQVVDNLVKNAIEAIGDRQGTVLVRTGRQIVTRNEVVGMEPGTRLPAGDYLFVEVHDNGVGMTPETQRQMFDPFFTTKFTGRGLGLAAVQGIVRGHHGTILVTSQPGRGTTVRALFATTPAIAAPTAQQPAVATRRGTETILLVDDEPLVLTTAHVALQQHGFVVIAAASGSEALTAMRAHPEIAAVVLDATMPGMDGKETLHGLRQLRPALPVLVASGRGDAETEAAFRDLKVTGFVHKPFTMQQLVERLLAILPAPA